MHSTGRLHTADQLGPTPYRYNPVLRAYIDRYCTLLSAWLAKESFRPR